MLARDPSASGTQKKKQHSPIVYRNCPVHEDTPRRSIWDRIGDRNKPSVKSRLEWPQTTFDRNRLGPRIRTQSEIEKSKKKWSKWVMTSATVEWKPEMEPRCTEFNRRIWLPQQKSEWNSDWHREIRRQMTHTFGGTSNCPLNEESDELGGIDSTDHKEN